MKAYEDLTRLGRLRRMRQLVRTALDSYGLAEVHCSLVVQAGNTLYRIHDQAKRLPGISGNLFEEDQYLLRIYASGWQPAEASQLELDWLAAMRREADLPVQEPISSLSGDLLMQIAIPGLPEPRQCSLLRWVKGRELGHRARALDYHALGQLMARMHNFAERWQHPAGHSKRRYDWNGLFRNDPEIGLPPGECWKYLPEAWIGPFDAVARQTRQVMDAWGQGPEIFGLIHADMGMNANVLFWRGEPRLIDFEGSGFGYWIYDIAASIEDVWEKPECPEYRNALLDGYAEFRSLPQEQLDQLDLILAAFCVYYSLWMVGAVHLHPEDEGYFQPILDRAAGYVIHFAEKGRAR